MPSTKELSDELEVEEWKIIEAMSIKNAVKSLDEPVSYLESEYSFSDTLGKCDKYNIEVEELMSLLNNEEREIIQLRYFNDKSQEEVAMMTGFSQAKISRIETKVLKRLREYYET